jgi:hypothetical protein
MCKNIDEKVVVIIFPFSIIKSCVVQFVMLSTILFVSHNNKEHAHLRAVRRLLRVDRYFHGGALGI